MVKDAFQQPQQPQPAKPALRTQDVYDLANAIAKANGHACPEEWALKVQAHWEVPNAPSTVGAEG